MDALVASGFAWGGLLIIVFGALLLARLAFNDDGSWLPSAATAISYGLTIGIPLMVGGMIVGWILGQSPSGQDLDMLRQYWVVKPSVGQLVSVLGLAQATVPGLWLGLGGGMGLGFGLGLGAQRPPHHARSKASERSREVHPSQIIKGRKVDFGALSAIAGTKYFIWGFIVGLGAAVAVFGDWFNTGGPARWFMTNWPFAGFTEAFHANFGDELVYGLGFGLLFGIVAGYTLGQVAEWMAGGLYFLTHREGAAFDEVEYTVAFAFFIALVPGFLIGQIANAIIQNGVFWGIVAVLFVIAGVVLTIYLLPAVLLFGGILLALGAIAAIIQHSSDYWNSLLGGLGNLVHGILNLALFLALLAAIIFGFAAFQGVVSAMREHAPELKGRVFDWYSLIGGILAGVIVTLFDTQHVSPLGIAVALGFGVLLALLPWARGLVAGPRLAQLRTAGIALLAVGVTLFSIQLLLSR